MGRKPWSDRLTVEDCLALDIAILKTQFRENRAVEGLYRWLGANGAETAVVGYRVIPGYPSGPALELRYLLGSSRNPVEYTVQITTTPTNFGQSRYWLVCPLVRNGVQCLKRAGKLYLPPGGRYFGCRGCYNLTYDSTKNHDGRVDAMLRLPAEELHKVLLDDTLNLGSLLSRCQAGIARRLRRKIAG